MVQDTVSIFDETQEDRDLEVARYLGIDPMFVRNCHVEMKFGPTIYPGMDYKAESYDDLYERLGSGENRIEVLKAFTMFNIVKRKELVMEAMKWIGKVEGIRFLDFGCGPAGHGIHMSQCGARQCHYLDVNGELYRFGRWRVRERGLHENVRFFFPVTRLPGNYYDVVFCIDVLEHTADPLAQFNRVVRSIRPGGKLVLQYGYKRNPQQGHFKQSRNIWQGKKCVVQVKKSLNRVEKYFYTKR